MKLASLVFTSLVLLIIGGVIGYSFGYDIGFEKAKKVNPQTETVSNNNAQTKKNDFVIVDTPKPNDIISSPLEITGEARGTWYFEGSFPIYLYDSDGNELAVVPAQAQGEWMTEDFVPFSVILRFDKPETQEGELVFKKDNPSGLVKFDDEIRIPVAF